MNWSHWLYFNRVQRIGCGFDGQYEDFIMLQKRNNFPSKFWHCIVLFIVVCGVVPAIFLAVNPIVGISNSPPPYPFLLPMTAVALLSCFVY